jgi:tetratricopeptide (TPR) repeat protein
MHIFIPGRYIFGIAAKFLPKIQSQRKKVYFCTLKKSTMTKLHNEKKAQDQNLVDLGGSYDKLNAFFNKNKNIVYGAVAAIIIGVGGYLGYINMIKGPREKEAATAMFKAEYYFGLDSFNLALNGRGEDFMGFQQIADDYGNTKAGNLAHYYGGVCYLRIGKFEEAIDMLKDFSSGDVLVGPIALGCIGDAYRELGNAEEAAKYYEKAANKNDNSFTSPMYLKKAGMTYEEDLKNYDKALAMYKKIRQEYSNTMEGRDISKYIARIETMNGK